MTNKEKSIEYLQELLDGTVQNLHVPEMQDYADALKEAIGLLSEQSKVIRCKGCIHRYDDDECPMRHVEWVEYDDDGYLDTDDVVYDYTEDNGYCNFAENEKGEKQPSIIRITNIRRHEPNFDFDETETDSCWEEGPDESSVRCPNCGAYWDKGLVENCDMEYCPSCGNFNGEIEDEEWFR